MEGESGEQVDDELLKSVNKDIAKIKVAEIFGTQCRKRNRTQVIHKQCTYLMLSKHTKK